MAESPDSNPENGNVIVSIALEMKSGIVKLAGNRRPHDSQENMIARAARSAGITFRQAKSLFYGETADPKSSVVERVRMAVRGEKQSSEEAARDEYAEILNRMDRIETLLLASHPDMDREALAQVRPLYLGEERRGRPVDRAMDRSK